MKSDPISMQVPEMKRNITIIEKAVSIETQILMGNYSINMYFIKWRCYSSRVIQVICAGRNDTGDFLSLLDIVKNIDFTQFICKFQHICCHSFVVLQLAGHTHINHM